VKSQLDVKVELDSNIMWLLRPLIRNAYVYESMWVYGNHYHVDMESWPLMHMTYDYGVACIFRQASHSSTRDHNMVMANLNYVVVLKEILVVDYSSLLLVLFNCSWIPTNTQGNATICQDGHGFWVVNFIRCLLPMVEPYVFPTFVSQVWAPRAIRDSIMMLQFILECLLQ
jgi:hypothetical protein